MQSPYISHRKRKCKKYAKKGAEVVWRIKENENIVICKCK